MRISSSSFDGYIESGMRALRHLKSYRKIARRIKRIVTEKCGDAKVLVFGSVVEGKVTALSDIDILVICDLDEDERVRLKSEIYRKLGYDLPIELHIASEKEFQGWYRRFIGKFEEI